MTDQTITRLFAALGLGEVLPPVLPVSGGFLHSMFRVRTAERTYAVKCLNAEIMKRPDAMENYQRAERLERILEDAQIPIVPALTFSGRKMQQLDGGYFYIFHWQSGRMTDWHHITPEQCAMAGNIQGRIHALQPRRTGPAATQLSAIDWAAFQQQADRQNPRFASLLRENEALLTCAEAELNRARQALPDLECITDDDMDPKNVMWDHGRPLVIDLECLDYGNPVSSVVQLSLQWAGITTCSLDFEKLKAFFTGYREAWDNGFRDYGSVLGLAYTWLEWLAFNVQRALGHCQDERERDLGALEAEQTLARIRYIRDREEEIHSCLRHLF